MAGWPAGGESENVGRHELRMRFQAPPARGSRPENDGSLGQGSIQGRKEGKDGWRDRGGGRKGLGVVLRSQRFVFRQPLIRSSLEKRRRIVLAGSRPDKYEMAVSG